MVRGLHHVRLCRRALCSVLTTAALAASGEFSNMLTEGLSLGKDIATDCSINTQLNARTIALGVRKQWPSS